MASDTEKAAMQTNYDLHQHNKNLARKNKEDDKEKGKQANSELPKRRSVELLISQKTMRIQPGHLQSEDLRCTLTCFMWMEADAKRHV